MEHVTLPREPSQAMLDALRTGSRKDYPSDELCRVRYAALIAAAPAAEPAREKMVRFCPGCGSVGDVPDKYRDCCPDGSHARMIPESLAIRCRDLFRLAIKAAAADAQPEQGEPSAEAVREACAMACEKQARGWRVALEANIASAISECATIIRAIDLSKIGRGE